jgi:hypothetical protein
MKSTILYRRDNHQGTSTEYQHCFWRNLHAIYRIVRERWMSGSCWLKRALFQISPINRSSQRVVFAPHYIFTASCRSRLWHLSGEEAWQIFDPSETSHMFYPIETGWKWGLAVQIHWIFHQERQAAPLLLRSLPDSRYNYWASHSSNKSNKCCVCLVNIHGTDIMRVNYELRQLLVVDRPAARVRTGGGRERKKVTDNVICRVNIRICSFSFQCSEQARVTFHIWIDE